MTCRRTAIQLTSKMTNAQLDAALSRSEETVVFLQCDHSRDRSPSFAQMNAIICDQIVPQ